MSIDVPCPRCGEHRVDCIRVDGVAKQQQIAAFAGILFVLLATTAAIPFALGTCAVAIGLIIVLLGIPPDPTLPRDGTIVMVAAVVFVSGFVSLQLFFCAIDTARRGYNETSHALWQRGEHYRCPVCSHEWTAQRLSAPVRLRPDIITLVARLRENEQQRQRQQEILANKTFIEQQRGNRR